MSRAYSRDFVGYGKDYPGVTWPDNARIALSLVVNVEEGSERTPYHGDPAADPMSEGFYTPPGVRDLRNESMFEYGSRRGFWRLLELFDKYGVKITYFISAMAIEANPESGRAITAHGHEPCSHGYRWLPLYSLSDDEEREHVRRAVEVIERVTGERPRGWYTRGPSHRTRELLVEEGGFLYDSDSYSDDLPYFVDVKGKRFLTIPYSFETNDMKFFRSPGHSQPEDFLLQLKATFDQLYEEGATHPQVMSVGLHMRHIGRPSAVGALENFLRYARGFPRVWFARRIDIARWWLDHYSHFPAMSS